jgi:uncharacterized protein
VQPTPESQAAGLHPPDPWVFSRCFLEAALILESHSVDAVYASADITARQVSFCPVANDAVIVGPDGLLTACYLLQKDWEGRGFDLRLGRIQDHAVTVDTVSLERVRSLNIWNKPFCADCFCQWHCAGGCHVNHLLPEQPGAYDRLCLQTRAIALGTILRAMGREDVSAELLADRQAWEAAVWQSSDAIHTALG